MDLTPCIWFDGNGLDAAHFYASIFPDSSVDTVPASPDETPIVVAFTLGGRPFQAINGGPQFTPTEAISFVVPVDGQAEVDHYWDALLDGGGEESMCGWLRDRFGVSWQIVPHQLGELLGDPDPGRAQRATEAMLGMRKLDLAAMRAAADRAPHH
jgi:predicted 3-demethylubiquinone-9 3-methyltransferase (glyoxalase superfamily)